MLHFLAVKIVRFCLISFAVFIQMYRLYFVILAWSFQKFENLLSSMIML